MTHTARFGGGTGVPVTLLCVCTLVLTFYLIKMAKSYKGVRIYIPLFVCFRESERSAMSTLLCRQIKRKLQKWGCGPQCWLMLITPFPQTHPHIHPLTGESEPTSPVPPLFPHSTRCSCSINYPNNFHPSRR